MKKRPGLAHFLIVLSPIKKASKPQVRHSCKAALSTIITIMWLNQIKTVDYLRLIIYFGRHLIDQISD